MPSDLPEHADATAEPFRDFSRSCQVPIKGITVEVGWSQEQETFFAYFLEPEDREPLEPLGWEPHSYHFLDALIVDISIVLQQERGIEQPFSLEPSLYAYIRDGVNIEQSEAIRTSLAQVQGN